MLEMQITAEQNDLIKLHLNNLETKFLDFYKYAKSGEKEIAKVLMSGVEESIESLGEIYDALANAHEVGNIFTETVSYTKNPTNKDKAEKSKEFLFSLINYLSEDLKDKKITSLLKTTCKFSDVFFKGMDLLEILNTETDEIDLVGKIMINEVCNNLLSIETSYTNFNKLFNSLDVVSDFLEQPESYFDNSETHDEL